MSSWVPPELNESSRNTLPETIKVSLDSSENDNEMNKIQNIERRYWQYIISPPKGIKRN